MATVILCTNSAIATPKCFRVRDIEAVQAVRYMTELMVLNDTCRRHVYESFIRHNFSALSAYHRELVDHFRAIGDRHPNETVDKLVTRIANDTSRVAGKISTASLCDLKAEYFANAQTLSGSGFRRFITELAATQRSKFRRCTNQRATGQ